ncbi:hypothetical protein HPB51_008898 [Rhipicephalus microplus]|uniref:Uncharacterized protein n=1 Tax=Rhipicephalus microplus TaxID=6941 RepID=A0A9J6ESJ3_RHIMP|nr:hypothetical protein HPB51_008898 [Rhipicephalus microplus]
MTASHALAQPQLQLRVHLEVLQEELLQPIQEGPCHQVVWVLLYLAEALKHHLVHLKYSHRASDSRGISQGILDGKQLLSGAPETSRRPSSKVKLFPPVRTRTTMWLPRVVETAGELKPGIFVTEGYLYSPTTKRRSSSGRWEILTSARTTATSRPKLVTMEPADSPDSGAPLRQIPPGFPDVVPGRQADKGPGADLDPVAIQEAIPGAILPPGLGTVPVMASLRRGSQPSHVPTRFVVASKRDLLGAHTTRPQSKPGTPR